MGSIPTPYNYKASEVPNIQQRRSSEFNNSSKSLQLFIYELSPSGMVKM